MVTLWGLIESAAQQHPDRRVFSDDYGRVLTTARLRDAAERVAAGLEVGPGDVVSWQLPNVLEATALERDPARDLLRQIRMPRGPCQNSIEQRACLRMCVCG